MASEPVKVLDRLPIFPLEAVLFPGAILPLHIFEERYKAMMRYAIDNQGQFGLSYRTGAAVGKQTQPDIGTVGCAAKINAVMPLDEGRMNILSTGLIRYRLVEFVQIVPFLLAQVDTFSDDPDAEGDLTRLLDDTREIAEKFLEAVQSLNDSAADSNIELPDEPEAFSLFLCSTLPIENEAKQVLLEMTSTRLRLTRVRHYLINALSSYGARLRLHERAKGNGHNKPSKEP
jgi:Lon protease-like protein